jgi:hypothetical protein
MKEGRNDLYLPCTMTLNNADWERAWLYLRNDGIGLSAYTRKVLTERPDSWVHGVYRLERRKKVKPFTVMAEAGLTTAAVIANIHEQRVVPLMEKALPIFKMTVGADPRC